MRLPGTIAWPSKPQRVPEMTNMVMPPGRPAEHTIAFLERSLPQISARNQSGMAPAISGAVQTVDTGAVFGTVRWHIQCIKAGDQWHNHMVRLVAHWIGRGWSDVEILSAAASFTLPGYTAAQTEAEVRQAIDGARRKWGVADSEPTGRIYDAETGEITEPSADASPQQRQPLWRDDGAPDGEAVPVRPWVAVGYLMRGSVSVLSGQGAGGKSSLCVGLTISLATGRKMGGFEPIRPVRVVNYNVEDDQDEQRRRYLAALQAQGLTGADIAKRIMRCGPHDIGTLFVRHPETGQIMPTAAMQQLEALCSQEGIEVLICDPLAELHNVEENDNTAMRAIIAAFRAMAKRLNIAVLILHHDRKGTSTPGDMDRVRGASAISGAVRVMLTLTTMSTEEAEKFGIPADQRRRHFRIDGAKSNYAPATEADWWRLDGYQIPNGETVAAALPWQPPGVFEGISLDTCIAMVGRLHRGQDGFPFAVKGQAKGSALEMMTTEPFNLEPSKASAVLGAWTREGLLREVPSDSPNSRHKRLGYVVNEVKFSEMRQSARDV
jgi:hypothetical protein